MHCPACECTVKAPPAPPLLTMFDDLMQIDASAALMLDRVSPDDVLTAQANTASWLGELGVPSDEAIDERHQVRAAREVFKSIVEAPAERKPVDVEIDDAIKPKTAKQRAKEEKEAEQAKDKLLALKTPSSVQHLLGLLTAYDWEFVEKAKELRNYTVARILEETTHPDARIRLQALRLLGTVTEVGLFTERVEVTRKDATEAEIEARLRERLSKYAIDVTPTEVTTPALAHEPPAHDAGAETLDLDAEISVVADVRGADART